MLCSLVFCSLSVAWGADESSRILFSRLGEAEGFDAERVNAIVEDERGMIWLATDRGLSRFDGASALELRHDPNNRESLSSNRISSLAFGPNGELWVGTADAGLNRLEPVALTVERLALRSLAGENAFRSDEITSLAVSERQYLLVGSRRGLDILHLQSGKIQTATGIPDGTPISQIFEDSNGAIWASAESGELFRWDAQKSRFSQFWSIGVPISALANAPGNELWIATRGQGLLKLNPSTGKAAQQPLESRHITSVLTDTNGNLWVGTRGGLAHLERGAFEFIFYRNNPHDATSLGNNHVAILFESRAKILWVGTAGGSASRFGLNRSWFPHYRSNPDRPRSERLPHDSIWSMAPAKGKNLWIGTESGLTLWNPDREEYLTPEFGPEIGSPYISAIVERDDGTVWAGTRGDGLILLPEGDSRRAIQMRHRDETPESIGHDFISAIFDDSRSTLWIGTYGNGLWQLEESGRTFRPVAVQEPGDPKVTGRNRQGRFVVAIAEDKAGRVCVAATDGLFAISPGGRELVPYDQVVTLAQPLPGHSLSSVLQAPDGTLLVGTQEDGLIQIDPETGRVESLSRSNADLPSDRILGLLTDADGLIWITTSKGIARFDSTKKQFRIFDDLDGLQSSALHPNTGALAGDGTLYFGGQQGFHRIDPSSLPLPRQPPTPYLTGFERFGEMVTPRPGGILEKSIAATSEVRLPFDRRNRFAFHFANLGTDSPFRGEFRYRLIGFEENWQVASAGPKASYAAMLPGTYEFQVQSSPDGFKWNANPARVSLVITPPWWQTWWARTVFTILAISIAGLVFWTARRAQLRRMRQRERVLKSQRDEAEAQLAIQLQNAVLLERTAHSFNDNLRQDDVFERPLKNLAKHYGVDRCILCSLESNPETGASQLVAIGEHRANGKPRSPEFVIPSSDPFTVEILASETPVQRDRLLAMRTSFQGVSNGVLVIDGASPSGQAWSAEEVNLLQSVAVQFGIAIAQRNLTLKEESYRHQLEQARRAAEKANQAKTSFLARMTHDLRTPLSAILGFTRLFQEDQTLSPKQRETINIISDSGEHLLAVINDTLDMAKIEAGKVELNSEKFELLPLLESIQEILKEKVKSKGLTFHFSAVTSLPRRVETDRGKLRQILINLLGNAIKFTDKGSISLKVAARAESSQLEPAENEGLPFRLFFQVSDTGRGIAQKDFHRLFQEFSQTDSGRGAAESTGLGLSIAKSFSNLLGGDIDVSSEVGVGTTFEFSILCREVAALSPPEPLDPAGPRPSEIEEKSQVDDPSLSPRDFRILIADDEKLNRLLLSKILVPAGYQLTEAADGDEACDKWRENRPHLILMDENMPGMKGSEASRVILQECESGKEPILISLTANAFAEAREEAIAAGFRDFICKPFQQEDLLAKIAHHLGVNYGTDYDGSRSVVPRPEGTDRNEDVILPA